MRRLFPVVLALGGALACLAASRLYDPYLSWIGRPLVAAILLASAAALILLWRLRTLVRPGLALVLAALWAGAPFLLVAERARFEAWRAEVFAAPAGLAQKLGAHFVVGYTRREDIEPLVERGLIGGIFLGALNATGRTAAQIAEEVESLQALRRANGLPPLVVACDQEGGMVSRLSPPLERPPALSSLAPLPREQAMAEAGRIGAAAGAALKSLGVTLNLAPVLDLRPASPPAALDFHSRIRDRAISDDPETVAAIGAAYMRGLAQAGVRGAAKHFPGLGAVTADTHHFRAALDAPLASLQAREFAPFRAALAQAPGALMVGHVAVEAVEPGRPASQSKKLIEGVLRELWGFQGPVITDDLVMSAVFQHGAEQGMVATANAGADLWLVSFDGRQYYRLMAALLRAAEAGDLDMAMLEASGRRLKPAP